MRKSHYSYGILYPYIQSIAGSAKSRKGRKIMTAHYIKSIGDDVLGKGIKNLYVEAAKWLSLYKKKTKRIRSK